MAAPALTGAVEAVLQLDVEADGGVAHRWAELLALETWNFDALQTLAARQVQLARDTGAHVQLQFALNFLANTHLLAGELGDRGRPRGGGPPDRGGHREPARRVQRHDARRVAWRRSARLRADQGGVRGTPMPAASAGSPASRRYPTAVLNNGLGLHEARGTPRAASLTATWWGTARSSHQSSPRRRREPATRHC